ncbi:MAG: RdgB/HAM1 family non-canonical purine NTP pyrophosphatase [Mariprofundales bacterium]|nr:RdgB/HAM1 family non-canonical purine NTP pyrophosphatase [Mariprofundales bacterium]
MRRRNAIRQLVIASNNPKKRQEIAAMLAQHGIAVVSIEETRSIEVVEDGDSFAVNASKKASAFAEVNQLPALADDSGLCVAALNGAPGIYSSRYAGVDGDDAANNHKLLQALAGERNRAAWFCCHMHLAFPDGRAPHIAEGRVDGHILSNHDGVNGFGYDPLFFCPELDVSFACATPAQKARVSHRGRALRALANQLHAA